MPAWEKATTVAESVRPWPDASVIVLPILTPIFWASRSPRMIAFEVL